MLPGEIALKNNHYYYYYYGINVRIAGHGWTRIEGIDVGGDVLLELT